MKNILDKFVEKIEAHIKSTIGGSRIAIESEYVEASLL
jgi:hypothetical protein